MADWWDKYSTVESTKVEPTEENWWDKYPSATPDFTPAESFKEIGKAALRMPQHMLASVGKVVNYIGEHDPAKSWLPVERVIGKAMDYIQPEWMRRAEDSQRKMIINQGTKIADFWTEAANTGLEAPSKKLRMAKWYEAPVTKALTTAIESSGPFLSAIAAGVITKNPHIGLVLLGGMSGAETHYELRKRDVDQEIAQNLGLIAGAWEAATELVPFNIIFNKPAKSLLRKFLVSGSVESLQEFIQGMGENWLLNFGYKVKKGDWSSVPKAARIEWSELMNNWFENITAGFLLGGGAGAVIGVERPTRKAPTVPIEPTPVTPEVIPTAPTEEVITAPESDEIQKRESILAETPDITPEEMESTLQAESDIQLKEKFEQLLGAVERFTAPAVAERKEAIRKEKGKRFGAARELLREGGERELLFIAKRELMGEYEKAPEFTPVQELGQLTPDEIAQLRVSIRTDPTLLDAEAIRAEDALNKVLEEGVVPQDAEIRLLERALGRGVGESLKRLRGRKRATVSALLDDLNAARTLKASMDLSFGGRQGIVMAATHPVLWANSVVEGWRIFLSGDLEAMAEQIDFDLRTGKYYRLSQESGLDLTDWRGPITKREEQFQSTLFNRLSESKIPVLKQVAGLIKRSNIAFTTTANKFRTDVFDYWASQWEGTGQSKEEYEHLAKFINHATGRADLKWFAEYAPALNATFFSPQFRASRFLLPVDAAMEVYRSGRNAEWTAASQMMFSNLAGFVGSGLLALGLFSMIAGVDVEDDPRSADFGKIRYGDMRMDFWAGYTPIARVATQLMTGERKVTDTGKIQGVDAGDVLWRYLRSGFSPPISLATNLLTGKNWIGEEMELTADSVGKSVRDVLAPLALQDMYEAFKNQGLIAGSISVPLAFHGIGVQTYPISPSKQSYLTKDIIAQRVYGEKWDNLGPFAQKLLRENRPQIELAEMKARAERERPPYLEKMLTEQFKVGQRLQKNLPKDIRNELSRLMIQTGGLSRRVGSDWWLNDKRYKTYQKEVSKGLNKVLSRIVRHRNWIRLSDGQKRELLDEVIDMTKKRARQQLIATAEIKDLMDTKELAR